MQFGNIKAFIMLYNHHQCLHSHLLILFPHFPAKPGFMSSTPHSSLPHLTTFSRLLSPFLPILWVSAINANHWNDRKKWTFFLTEREHCRHLVLLGSFQSHGIYSPWSYLGQNTRLGNFFILLGIFWLSTYCKTKLENSCFYSIWSSLWVTERTL